MALTESKIKDLVAKQFDKLFERDGKGWLAMAKTASDFAKKNITEGRPPRPDDIAKALYPTMEVNEQLRKHQEDNQARARRFTEWFTEYVIDKYLAPSKPEQSSTAGAGER